jgi:hypothetical protein
MSKDTEQIMAFNKACGDFLGIDMSMEGSTGILYHVLGDPYDPIPFDPYHNANDRNRVIEKRKINIRYLYPEHRRLHDVWEAIPTDDEYTGVKDSLCYGKSRDAVEIACIAKVLGVEPPKGADDE